MQIFFLRSDLEFALTLSIDWVALSFVQKPEDILELRALAGPGVKVGIHLLFSSLLFLFQSFFFTFTSLYLSSFLIPSSFLLPSLLTYSILK